MFNIKDIIKCEYDIDWKKCSLERKHMFSMAKHKMVVQYDSYTKARYQYLSDFENCILNHKELSHELFDLYVTEIRKFYNAYQIYSLEVFRCKGGNCL